MNFDYYIISVKYKLLLGIWMLCWIQYSFMDSQQSISLIHGEKSVYNVCYEVEDFIDKSILMLVKLISRLTL